MKTTLLIRKLVPVLLAVSLLLSLVGCSKGNTTTDPAKPAGKTITIKIAHAAAESHMLHKGWLKLKDELEMLKIFIFALKNQSRFSNVLKVTFEELEIEMWVMEKLEYLDKETKEKLIEKLLNEINKEIKIV